MLTSHITKINTSHLRTMLVHHVKIPQDIIEQQVPLTPKSNTLYFVKEWIRPMPDSRDISIHPEERKRDGIEAKFAIHNIETNMHIGGLHCDSFYKGCRFYSTPPYQNEFKAIAESILISPKVNLYMIRPWVFIKDFETGTAYFPTFERLTDFINQIESKKFKEYNEKWHNENQEIQRQFL